MQTTSLYDRLISHWPDLSAPPQNRLAKHNYCGRIVLDAIDGNEVLAERLFDRKPIVDAVRAAIGDISLMNSPSTKIKRDLRALIGYHEFKLLPWALSIAGFSYDIAAVVATQSPTQLASLGLNVARMSIAKERQRDQLRETYVPHAEYLDKLITLIGFDRQF
jgi:hypothetical protein